MRDDRSIYQIQDDEMREISSYGEDQFWKGFFVGAAVMILLRFL